MTAVVFTLLLLGALQTPPDAAPTEEELLLGDDVSPSDEAGAPSAEALLEDDALFERARSFEDPFPRCRQLLTNGSPRRAAACYQARVQEGDPEAELAVELARLSLARAKASGEPSNSMTLPPPAVDFLRRRGPELMLHSGLFGASSGFLLTAASVSAFRLDTARSLPILASITATGAIVGGGLGAAAALGTQIAPGDLALTTSALWVGTGLGVGLQLAVFEGNEDVAHIPWRFVTVLTAGAVPALAAGLAAPFFDVEAGDTGLANSAALWTPMLTYFGWQVVAPGSPLDRNLASTLIGVSSLAYAATLATFPLVDLPRSATWFIELGGMAGLIVAFASQPVLITFPTRPAYLEPLLTSGAVAAGLAAGTTATFLLAPFIRELPPLLPSDEGRPAAPASSWNLVPQIVPPAWGRPASYGATLEGRF